MPDAKSVCRVMILAGLGMCAATSARADFRDAMLMPYDEAQRAFSLPDPSTRNDPFLQNIVDPGGLKVEQILARFEPNSGPQRRYALYARGKVTIDGKTWDARVPVAFGDMQINGLDPRLQFVTYCDRTAGYGRPLQTMDSQGLVNAIKSGTFAYKSMVVPHYDAAMTCKNIPLPVTFDETGMQASVLGGAAQTVTSPMTKGSCDTVGEALVTSAVTYHELARRGLAGQISKTDVALRLSDASRGQPPCPIP